MQAVILAAGRGTRMKDFTENLPKPMLKVGNKTLLEYKLENLPSEIDEVIFVIGYKGDVIKNYFGDTFGGRKIKYVLQEKLEGTAKALWCAKDLVRGNFLVLYGDDIYSKEDLEKCITYDWAVLAKRRKEGENQARIILNEEGKLKDIVEISDLTEGQKTSNLINAGVYVLGTEFFNYEPVKLAGREEWGLPQTLISLSKDFPVHIVETNFWIEMTSPADLKKDPNRLT